MRKQWQLIKSEQQRSLVFINYIVLFVLLLFHFGLFESSHIIHILDFSDEKLIKRIFAHANIGARKSRLNQFQCYFDWDEMWKKKRKSNWTNGMHLMIDASWKLITFRVNEDVHRFFFFCGYSCNQHKNLAPIYTMTFIVRLRAMSLQFESW